MGRKGSLKSFGIVRDCIKPRCCLNRMLGSRDFSEAFTRAIFDTQMNATGSTFKVIRAILACEYAQDTQLAINGLLQDLPDEGGESRQCQLVLALTEMEASVQELILIALVSLLARHPNASVVVLEALRAIEGKSGKHIRKVRFARPREICWTEGSAATATSDHYHRAELVRHTYCYGEVLFCELSLDLPPESSMIVNTAP